MKTELFDHVLLKDGRKAHIVEILGNHDMYIVDVEHGSDYDTINIKPDQIDRIIT